MRKNRLKVISLKRKANDSIGDASHHVRGMRRLNWLRVIAREHKTNAKTAAFEVKTCAASAGKTTLVTWF
jgi:ethanolamine utilization cobalamin adenosyltransferase